MDYRFILGDRVIRQLDELPEDVQLQALNRMTRLPSAPRGRGTKKLKGYETVWAVRVGNYRVAYTIDDAEMTIHAEAVSHRRDFYPRLRRLPHLRSLGFISLAFDLKSMNWAEGSALCRSPLKIARKS